MQLLRALFVLLPALTVATKVNKKRYFGGPTWGPGQFGVEGSDDPFYTLFDGASNINFYLRADDGFAFALDPVEGNGGPLTKVASGYVHPGNCNSPNSCELIFQTDGNLVELYNGAPVWDAQTSGRGALLELNAQPPHAAIYDAAGNLIYFSDMPIPGGGPTGPPGECNMNCE